MATAVDSERRYHSTEAAYVLPNDAVEQERLDAQAAAIVEMIGGRPFWAPIQHFPRITKAVDVGCGTGIATLQIADLTRPSATVYGLDLSPIPERVLKIAPSNVVWATGNVLDVDPNTTEKPAAGQVGDIFAPNSLDYIFGRMLFLGINDWTRYFATAARSLSSGGIIEHQDLDWAFYRVGTSERLDTNWEWHRRVVAAAHKAGLSTKAGSDAASLMKDAGLEIISVQTFEFSFVPSRKTSNSIPMGNYVMEKLVPNYPELLRKMLGGPDGVSGDELERLTKQAVADIQSEEGIHQKYTVTIARKP
ncbi:S-adenosyl-L-methionine-dependent methyltransferase [Rhypophila sp. PSN 637]